MINILKRAIFFVTLSALLLSVSSCAREDFPTQLYEIEYDNVDYDIEMKIITGEKNGEVFVLDKQGQPLYPQSKYQKAGKIGNNTYYYHFKDNNRIELLDENGIIQGEYANVPEGFTLPDPQILLSDRNIVLTGKEWDYIYYDKITGDVLLELQADRCENFENGIAVVENASSSGNRTLSDIELSMNGHSLNGYISEDNFKFFITEANGTFSTSSDPQFVGQPYVANGLYEASYCQNGILPHLVTISKNVFEEQIKYTPYYVFKDAGGNIISEHMFRETSGFKEGIAFCKEFNNPNITIISLDGQYITTQLKANDYSLNRVYYYPDFDCFGITKSGKSTTPDAYVTRSGMIIANTPNKVKLFSEIIKYGHYIDYETISMALELVNNENEEYVPIIFDTGIIISSPAECIVYIFNYETHDFQKYQTDKYKSDFYISKIDDKYASTSCGVVDMTTSEIVNKRTNVIAYDEKTGIAYLDKITESEDGAAQDIVLGYYKDENTLVKYDCSECKYLGDGQFIIKQNGKYYTTILF